MSTCILTQQDCGCYKTIWNNKCCEIIWNYGRCCKIGDQFAINIEHHVHWFYIQINFTNGGSFTITTYCYRLCFLKKGAIHYIVRIQEISRMQWLEYGCYLHEGMYHLINLLHKHLHQVYVDPICNRHVPKLFIMSHPNYVVMDLFIIVINRCPLFLASRPIFDV